MYGMYEKRRLRTVANGHGRWSGYCLLRETGRKHIPGTRKLSGMMAARKILLYTPLLKWFLDHGLEVTAFHQFLRYKRGKPFAWFPEEVADARRKADEDPDKRIVGDTAKLKANSFYG